MHYKCTFSTVNIDMPMYSQKKGTTVLVPGYMSNTYFVTPSYFKEYHGNMLHIRKALVFACFK